MSTPPWQKLMTAIAASQLFLPKSGPCSTNTWVEETKSKMNFFTCILKSVSSCTHTLSLNAFGTFQISVLLQKLTRMKAATQIAERT